MSVLKDVRLHCLDCCCGMASEVKNCQIKVCHLWPYRMGKDSTRTRTMTDEQKQVAAERMKLARIKKKSLFNNDENADE